MEYQEKLNLQAKEVQDALSQRKLAMSEYSEVSDKWVNLFFIYILSAPRKKRWNSRLDQIVKCKKGFERGMFKAFIYIIFVGSVIDTALLFLCQPYVVDAAPRHGTVIIESKREMIKLWLYFLSLAG